MIGWIEMLPWKKRDASNEKKRKNNPFKTRLADMMLKEITNHATN